MIPVTDRNPDLSALRGEPSHVWRAGQQRRLEMVLKTAGERIRGEILENGCGVGMYVEHLKPYGGRVFGLDFELSRVKDAATRSDLVFCAAGEELPFPDDSFDLVLSHEVIEHVNDDQAAIMEIIRTLRPGGRLALFCPNRGYPFETHGIYFRGRYRFGNIPLVNYLPRSLRDRLAPHVCVYSRQDLEKLFEGLPVIFVTRTVIFGAYDNIIARWPRAGKALRSLLQFLEGTPLRIFGLSHFWVVEKV
ncbi:MAG: class I SAM-dependent methyltransferase [Chloroflexi bacterium]|nr:class I SAM-dependent methyltransferase [Chloroflexota bacterium]